MEATAGILHISVLATGGIRFMLDVIGIIVCIVFWKASKRMLWLVLAFVLGMLLDVASNIQALISLDVNTSMWISIVMNVVRLAPPVTLVLALGLVLSDVCKRVSASTQ